MHLNLRLIILIPLLLFVTILFSQEVGVPNLSGSYLSQSYRLFNPASIKSGTNKGNVLLSHKQGLGVFSEFSQNYLNANFRFGPDSLNKHGVGVRILNDQAGKYISLNRVSLLYNYTVTVSSRAKLALGVAPTIINYKKKAQGFGGNARASNLDVGLWFATESVELGFSFNQLIYNELVVISELSLIQNQYVLNATYNHKVHPLIDLDYKAFYKINTSLMNEQILGVTINYSNNYRASVNYESLGTAFVLLGLKEIAVPQLSGDLSLDFIYGFPMFRKTEKPRSEIEIMLNYEF